MATREYPGIDVAHGGTINGVIDGLNKVLELAIPEFRLEGGTMMVPASGRIVDSGDVAYYRDMLTIIRDRVQDLIKKEMTLDEVLAARPTADYDTQYGATHRPVDDAHVRRGGLQEPGRRQAATPPARRAHGAGRTRPRARGCASSACVGLAGARGARRRAARRSSRRRRAADAARAAPLDLTGQWVSLVTDDWRWRMVVPPKGDTLYLPVNDAGRRWRPSGTRRAMPRPARRAAATAPAASCTCPAGCASRGTATTR